MSAEPVAVEKPAHPVHALTTSELSSYRRELEDVIRTIDPGNPVQAGLQGQLDLVVAEEDQRANIARGGRWDEAAGNA